MFTVSMNQRRHRPVVQSRKHTALRGRTLVAAALGLLVLNATGAVMAETGDRDKPIRLEADKVTIDDAKQVAVFEGNVILRQGSLELRGNRMEVRQDKSGFKYGVAWGKPAYFRQKQDGADGFIEAWADRLEYDGQAETLKMFDRAKVKRGQDEIRGNFISYDAKTEFYKVIGGSPNGGSKASTGRGHAVIQPKPKTKPPPSPPPGLKPSPGVTPPREKSQTREK